MLPPLICAVYYNEFGPASSLSFTACCCIALGMLIFRFLKYYTLKIKQRESYFIAFLCWFVVSLVGTLPYMFSGCGYSFIDCVFESVSGWTTTGAWTIPLETMPRSLILWKAITNWLGGMGLLLADHLLLPCAGRRRSKDDIRRGSRRRSREDVGQDQRHGKDLLPHLYRYDSGGIFTPAAKRSDAF